jgi:hypothetical protein
MACSRIIADKNWGISRIAGGLILGNQFTTYETGQPITSEIPLILPILG